jgi:anti-anti-sigma factor
MVVAIFGDSTVHAEARVNNKLEVQSLRTPRHVIVRVSGDAGLANLGRLEAELTSVVATHPPLVIIDFTDLMFIASRAMGALMSFQRRMSLQNGQIRVVAPPSRVRDALEIARLHSVLEIFDSLEAALKGKPEEG